MNKRKRTLSADDQKAIDVILDHAASGVARMASVAAPARVNAATKLLSLLSEMPVVEPPKDLVAKTMERIDQQTTGRVGRRSHNSTTSLTHLH